MKITEVTQPKASIGSKYLQRPEMSTLGRYPRSLTEAFSGTLQYGAAIEVPYGWKNALKDAVGALPKVLWGVSLAVLIAGVVAVVLG